MDTDAIKTALVTEGIDREIGWDLSFGLEYRPLLTDNVRLTAGLGLLAPGAGFKDIYSTSSPGVPGFPSVSSRDVPSILCSGFFGVTLTF